MCRVVPSSPRMEVPRRPQRRGLLYIIEHKNIVCTIFVCSHRGPAQLDPLLTRLKSAARLMRRRRNASPPAPPRRAAGALAGRAHAPAGPGDGPGPQREPVGGRRGAARDPAGARGVAGARSPVAADLFAGTERLPGWDAGRAPAFGASSMDEWVMAVFHGRMGKGFLRWTSGQGLLLGSKGCDAVDLPVPSPRMGVLQRTLVPPDPPPSISASQ